VGPLVELGRQAVTGAARPHVGRVGVNALGVAALDDKPWFHPVETKPVIEAAPRQVDEAGHGNRCDIGVEGEDYLSLVGLYDCLDVRPVLSVGKVDKLFDRLSVGTYLASRCRPG